MLEDNNKHIQTTHTGYIRGEVLLWEISWIFINVCCNLLLIGFACIHFWINFRSFFWWLCLFLLSLFFCFFFHFLLAWLLVLFQFWLCCFILLWLVFFLIFSHSLLIYVHLIWILFGFWNKLSLYITKMSDDITFDQATNL